MGRRALSKSGASGLRDWLTPLVLSLFIVPLPGLGSRAIPFFLVIWLLSDPRLRVRQGEVLIYALLVVVGFVMILLQPEKAGFLISLLLALLITRLLEVIPRDWSLIPALWLLLSAAGVSFLSLVSLGYDMIPMALYGESRHAIHANAFLHFRISGLYLEPSTFGLHMLLLSIWANHLHSDRRWVAMVFSVLALLTFSSITILAAFKIALDLRHLLRSRAAVVLVPLVAVGGGTALYNFYLFFTDKLILYQSRGLETAKRFEALFLTLDQISLGEFNFLLGHPPETIQKYVFYDLGPVLSVPLILGLGGVLVILVFLARMRLTVLNLAIVLATKATINNPLLWIATSRLRSPAMPRAAHRPAVTHRPAPRPTRPAALAPRTTTPGPNGA